MEDRQNPYITVVIVWIVSSFGLALVISFPISYVVLFFAALFLILAIVGCLVYRSHHKDLNARDLAGNLFSDFRRFLASVCEDFGIVVGRVSAWWLRREAQIQKEMAQKRARKARKREKLEQLERKRRLRTSNEYPSTRERDNAKRGSQEERAEG